MINNILYFTFMESCGWLEGDDGEEERGYCGEGEFPSESGELSLLGNFILLGTGCGSGSLDCL